MASTIRAVLFDLDGTLLENDIDAFLPPYFELLSARVSHLVDRDKFLKDLREATAVMVGNDGRATNEEVFAEAFYPRVGVPREELEPVLIDFYLHDFPRLRAYTRRNPAARRVVQAAFDRGYDVVIATNPLFPAIAIEHRLAWAGVADFAYDLVTTYENSRACKPNLLYYEQILEAIDRPAEVCLMVGDEAMDMVAAHLGCPTWLVPGPRTELGPEVPVPTYRGPLAGVEHLIEER